MADNNIEKQTNIGCFILFIIFLLCLYAIQKCAFRDTRKSKYDIEVNDFRRGI